MKVEVDDDICGGHGVCVSLAPDVFDLTAGYAVVKVEQVRREHQAAVHTAADQCPTHAITITS
jgi:ferredoxin